MNVGKYHGSTDHYDVLAGLLAGPCRLNITLTDDFDWEAPTMLSGFNLLVFCAETMAAPAVQTVLAAVRQGTSLLALHTGVYVIDLAAGGAQAVRAEYLEPHLAFQEMEVHIEDRSHPITRGIDDFKILDEPYRMVLLDGAHLLASYNGAQTNVLWTKPIPGKDEAEQWRLTQPHAPLLYNAQLGAGRVHVNAMGHDRRALTNASYRLLVGRAVEWLTNPA